MTSSVSSSPSLSPFKSSFNIFNPTTLFIAFSLGLHGLILLLVVPNLNSPSVSRQGNGTTNVDLVELSEAERALLPDLSPETFDPDDFNIPVGNIPDVASSDLEIDPLALQSALPNLPPPPPNLPPLNFGRNLPPVTTTPRSIPRRTYIPRTNYPNSNRFRSSIPAPPPNLPLPPSSSSYPRTNLPQQANRPNFDPIRRAIDPDDLINGRGLDSPSELNNQDNSPNIAANTPNNRQTSTPLAPRQLTARQLQDQRMRRLVADTQENARGLRYDSTNTTTQEAMKNDLALRAEKGVAEPKYSTLTGNYPKAACNLPLTGTTNAVYGVFVSPQGTLTQPPTQIKSTGYGILNRQALSQVRATRFANGSGYYQVSVNFRYDSKVCGSRTPIPTQPTESTAKPSPVAPAPSVSPQPSQASPRRQNQRSPQPAQQTPSPAPVVTEETPKPVPQQETPNNQIIIEASPQPTPETLSPAPAATEKPSIKPSQTEEAPQNQVETVPQQTQENRPPAPPTTRKAPPQPVQEAQPPVQQNQPPAPSATRKAPEPSKPVENQPPAPPTTRKAPPQPVQETQPPAPAANPKPVENQPPAPSATRKAPEPSKPVENQPPAPSAVRKPAESVE